MVAFVVNNKQERTSGEKLPPSEGSVDMSTDTFLIAN